MAESPMKDHPLTPMRDGNLKRLLAPQVTRPVGLVDRLTVAKSAEAVRSEMVALKADGIAHVVVDAVANGDLSTIAKACRDIPLMTGDSAIAMPLPEICKPGGVSSGTATGTAVPDLGNSAVVLSGSCSAMTNRQVVECLAQGKPAYRLDPADLAGNGPDGALNWLRWQDLSLAPVVYATADPVKREGGSGKAGCRKGSAVAEAHCAIDELLVVAILALQIGRKAVGYMLDAATDCQVVEHVDDRSVHV